MTNSYNTEKGRYRWTGFSMATEYSTGTVLENTGYMIVSGMMSFFFSRLAYLNFLNNRFVSENPCTPITWASVLPPYNIWSSTCGHWKHS